MEDLPAVLDLLRISDLRDWGSPDYTEQMLRYDWSLPDLELERDAWLVHADDGTLAAYSWVLGRDSHRRVQGWGVVHPDHRGRGLGTYLMVLREHGTTTHADLAPQGEPVVSQVGLIAPDREAHELAQRFGYREVRHFWQMVIELPDRPSEPRWSAPIRVRTFEPGLDARKVHATVMESFADHWGSLPMAFEDWARLRLEDAGFDPELWFLAVVGDAEQDEVAGALLGSIQDGEGWVDTLGVRPPWRRRGIGTALLRCSFEEFGRRGIPRVKLDVDASNEAGATRLYECVGMRVNRQYDVWEKER